MALKCTDSPLHQDAALCAQWLKCRTNHKDIIVRAEDSVSWEVLVRITVTVIQGMDLVTYVLCVPVLQEQSVSVTVSPHGKSPPAQPQSASKTQLITSTYTPFWAKTNSRQRLSISSRGKGAETRLFGIIIWRGTLTVFPRSSIMSLRGTWHASSCLSHPGEIEHLKPVISEETHTVQGA